MQSGGPEFELVTSRDTLLIVPTHSHPLCLPMALESAQHQSVGDIDIVVIGDGVSDDTRDAMSPILAGDERVRFLDLPKAIRHGEEYRDSVIRQSAASIISYLGDDDLIFPHHIETMRSCVAGVDFANPLPIFIRQEGTLVYCATDLSNPQSIAWHMSSRFRRNSISLTGVTHTRESYLRLPHGWRPAPKDRWADHYMWEQYFQLDGFTARTSPVATTLKFEQSAREDMTAVARASEIRAVLNMMAEPDFTERWNAGVAERIRLTAVEQLLRITELE